VTLDLLPVLAVAAAGVVVAAFVGALAWRAGALLAVSLLVVVLEVDVEPIWGSGADKVRDVVAAAALLLAAVIGWWRLDRDRLLVFATPIVYLLLLLGTGVLLAPWSIAPVGSAQRAAGATALVVVMLVVVARCGFLEVFEAVLVGLIIVVVASAVWELFGAGTPVLDWKGDVDTGLAGIERRSGLSGDPNALGRAAALCAVGGATLTGRGRGWLPITAEIVGLAGLFLAQSRTAMLVGVLVVVVVHIRQGFIWVAAAGAAVATLVTAILLSTGTSTVALVTREGADGSELATVTGRTGLWNVVWSMVWDHTFIGYGAFAAKEALEPAVENRWIPFEAADAHNLALDVFLTRGLFGVMLLVALVASILSHRPPRRRWPDPAVTLLVAFALLSLTENTLRKPAAPLMIVAVAVAALTMWPNRPTVPRFVAVGSRRQASGRASTLS